MFLLELNKTGANDNVRIRSVHLRAQHVQSIRHMLPISVKLDGITISIAGSVLHTSLKPSGKATVNGKVKHGIFILATDIACSISRAIIYNNIIDVGGNGL